MKHAVVFHIVYTYARAGAELVVCELAKAQQDAGYCVCVCALNRGGNAEDAVLADLSSHGVRCFTLSKGVRSGRLGAVAQLARLLRQEQVTLLHAHNASPTIYGVLAAILAGVRLRVSTVHGPMYQVRRFDRWCYRALGRYLQAFVSVSEDANVFLQRERLVRPDRLRVIHNGIRLERYQGTLDVAAARRQHGLGPDDFVIGCVGRLDPEKGHVYLVEAAKSLLERHPGVVFWLVGDGSQRVHLEALAVRLGIADRVRFLGRRQDVPELLACMEIFVFPSLWEGSPLALIEAAAAGKPVVAFRTDGVREVVEHGKSGLLVPPADPAAIADAVTTLMDNPRVRAEMGREAQARASLFSMERMVQGYSRLYESLWQSGFPDQSVANPCCRDRAK